MGPAGLNERWYEHGYYSSRNLGEHFRRGAEQFPDATLHFVGGPEPSTIGLAELHGRGRDVAAQLTSLGMGPGDVVAVWLPNWAEAAVAYQAVSLVGATALPIVHIYGPSEVGFLLGRSGAKMLLMPDRWQSFDYLERFAALPDLPDLRHVVVVGEQRPEGAIPWSRLADGDGSRLEVPQVSPDEVCLLIYTSGTTAEPKGVQHTHNTLYAETINTAAAIDRKEGVGLGAFPAGHIASVLNLLRMCTLGGSTVVMDRWDPALAARLVADFGVNMTAGAPIFLTTLMEEAERLGTSLATLDNYMVGAANVPAAVVERADRHGIPAYRAYGSSEHPVVTTGCPDDPLDKRATTDGRATAGNEIRLLDDDDVDVGLGNEGEIVTRGPELFVGYTDPALNAEAFLEGGWFRTGDIGRLDAEGYLTVTDRKKDVIIRGGENIASKEVEDVLATHPAVLEAAVVAMPDERYGERVAACVQLRTGATLELDEVRTHFATAGVARQKTPEILLELDDFPRTASGKIRKVDLRNQVATLSQG
jgi:acyl-CoA synthetase (AMP-forming)/AMP-acid ligase II